MFHGTIKLNPLGIFVICASVGIFIFYYLGFSKRDDTPANTVSVKTLLIASIVAARRGGFQVKLVHDSQSLNAKSKGKTNEGANNPVTNADLKSHHAIAQSLQQTLGKDTVKIISEEHVDGIDAVLSEDDTDPRRNLEEVDKLSDDDTVNLEDVTIWIDPLDATQEFTENLLEFVTVMVCVALKGKPLIGVIHNPFQQDTVWAWAGKEKSANLVPYRGDALETKHKKKVVVSRSHSGRVVETVKKVFGEDAEVVPAGGAGYKVLKVISGNADAYLHTTLIKKWDLCAGNALLNAVGGRMTTLSGKEFSYGFEDSERVEEGLLAALHHHETYLAKL